jgi:hypothetical protein
VHTWEVPPPLELPDDPPEPLKDIIAWVIELAGQFILRAPPLIVLVPTTASFDVVL